MQTPNPEIPDAGIVGSTDPLTAAEQALKDAADKKTAPPAADAEHPTPAWLRKFAADNHWSEDFARFDDATLASWLKTNWDPKAKKFTTQKKDRAGNKIPGFVEKPPDVPPGWVAWGAHDQAVRENDPVLGAAAKNGPTPAPVEPTTNNDLSNALLKLWAQDAGMFSDKPIDKTEVATVLPNGALWWGANRIGGPGPTTGGPDPIKGFFNTNPFAPPTNSAPPPKPTVPPPTVPPPPPPPYKAPVPIPGKSRNPLADALLAAATPPNQARPPRLPQ